MSDFKQYMIETYSHNELADMANHGANTGHHGLIWTPDMVKLYERFKDDLHAIIAEYNDMTGESGFPAFVSQSSDDADQFASAMVYFGAEWIANEVTQGEYNDEVEA